MKTWHKILLLATCISVLGISSVRDAAARTEIASYPGDPSSTSSTKTGSEASVDPGMRENVFQLEVFLQTLGDLGNLLPKALSGSEANVDSKAFVLLNQLGIQVNALLALLVDAFGAFVKDTWSLIKNPTAVIRNSEIVREIKQMHISLPQFSLPAWFSLGSSGHEQ